MKVIQKVLRQIKPAQWILAAVGLIFVVSAAMLGVADHPPGIISLYIALTCLAGAWVWNLPAPRDYWIIFLLSLAAFPAGVILHNLFYALSGLVSGVPVVQGLLEFLDVFFFLIAVMAVGPAALAGLVGGVIRSWQGMNRLTMQNRSIRRYQENHQIGEKKLRKLINLARQSASGANLQPLKFVLSSSAERNQLIFPTLAWAGYLPDWSGPVKGERPSAYIVLLGDTEIGNSFQYDAGIASQSITLGAAELGLGACLIGSIKRKTLQRALAIPEKYQILLVIALGKPAEQVVLDAIEEGEDIKYWRDEKGRHHVPKRGLDELILDL